MGVVYLARSRSGGPPLALKVLPPSRARERPRTLARFLREKEIGLRMPLHPNLTRTLDAGESDGAHYLAMEYVPGKTVKQLVNEGGPLAVGRAARVFADVATGLHAAHAAGFIHRDLKPANIIVTPAGRAKLLDFGFALIRGESTPTDPTLLGGPGYTLGTMDYLPPEQAVDPVGVGASADLYALGCSLYHALTGSPPFPGGSVRDKLRWHRTDPPPPLEQFTPAVPPDLVDLVTRLMSKRVEDRPSSAEEVALHLNRRADPIIPDSPLPGSKDLYHQVDEVWALARNRGDGTKEPEALNVVIVSSPAPRLSCRFVALALGVFGGIVTVSALLGWLMAQLLNG
jgi:serine/threonine protein kinase